MITNANAGFSNQLFLDLTDKSGKKKPQKKAEKTLGRVES